jgi:hypothetical protein
MFAVDLHTALAYLSLAAMAALSIEGAVRLALGRPPGRWSSRGAVALLLLVGVTAAGGLALLALGHRPRELLHLVYAVLAFSIVPTADSFSSRQTMRRRALMRFGSALIGCGGILRLIATG